MVTNNKKSNNDLQNRLDEYNKKTNDIKVKQQFKYTLAKNIFLIAMMLMIVKYLFFNQKPLSILETYLPFGYLFLFFVSFLLFLNVFSDTNKPYCSDDDWYDMDDD